MLINCIYFIIFIFSFCVSLYLLEKKISNINYSKIIVANFIYFIPKILGYTVSSLLLDAAFCITLITDIYEYSVFTVIPMVCYIIGLGSLFYFNNFNLMIEVIGKSFILWVLYKAIVFISQIFFNQEGFGKGDFYFLLGIIPYFDFIHFFILFFLACFGATIYSLFFSILFCKRIMGVPFIPFLYIAASLVSDDFIYLSIIKFIE